MVCGVILALLLTPALAHGESTLDEAAVRQFLSTVWAAAEAGQADQYVRPFDTGGGEQTKGYQLAVREIADQFEGWVRSKPNLVATMCWVDQSGRGYLQCIEVRGDQSRTISLMVLHDRQKEAAQHIVVLKMCELSASAWRPGVQYHPAPLSRQSQGQWRQGGIRGGPPIAPPPVAP